VVSVTSENLSALLQLAEELGVSATRIGQTGGSAISISISGAQSIHCSVAEAEQVWTTALERHFARRLLPNRSFLSRTLKVTLHQR